MKYKELKQRLRQLHEMNSGIDLDDFEVVFKTEAGNERPISNVKVSIPYDSIDRKIIFDRK